MKKLFILVSFAGIISLVSCKNESQQVSDNKDTTIEIEQKTETNQEPDENTEASIAKAKEAISEAPSFENEKLQEWAKKLYNAAIKAKTASLVGNNKNLIEATSDMVSLNEVVSSYSEDSEYSKAEEYYNQIKNELEQSEM